jgi:type VI secretion system protein ImpK
MANNEGSHISLREVFTPLVARVLLFAHGPEAGTQTFSVIRQEITSLLKEEEALIRRHEIAPKDYEDARFAVIAWLDEAMLKATDGKNPDCYQQWQRAPLQAELCNTTNAGEEFFTRLEKLRPSQKEIIEIFHLCLCLGFRGQFYDEEQNYRLLELRRERAQHLPISFPDLLDVEKQKEFVTPQPYEVKAPPQKRLPSAPSSLGAILLASVFALGLLYVLWPAAKCGNGQLDPGEQCDLSAGVTGCVDGQTCQANCTCPPPLPIPREEDLQKAIAPFASECCAITITKVQQGVVSLAGRVQSEGQRQQVHKAVREVSYVTEVQDTFEFIPRPFCEVVKLLDPFKKQAEDLGNPLTIRLPNGCQTTYHAKEELTINLSARKPLQYVYVDYYVADRKNVAHVLPHPQEETYFHPNKTTLTLSQTWEVKEPFGMELFTLISSARPLFAEKSLQGHESASVYLEELRQALAPAQAGVDVAATYCFIMSADK